MRIENIFVFGSNTQGRHGMGAALDAKKNYDAINGMARGFQGRSYAIVTKELRKNYPPVTLNSIKEEVDTFIKFAEAHPEYRFYVTTLGCGLAGFTPDQIGPFFSGSPKNVILPEEFKKYCLTYLA